MKKKVKTLIVPFQVKLIKVSKITKFTLKINNNKITISKEINNNT